jgi:antitoxin (DNA-binding transcriptional repressor) of toxin-antitoxin stability system
MRDHVARPAARRKGARKSVGVRELKTHAARILRQVREARTSYLLTHRGRAIGVILPLDSDDEPVLAAQAADATAAWEAFLQAGRRLERRFASGAKGVRLLSDMRR